MSAWERKRDNWLGGYSKKGKENIPELKEETAADDTECAVFFVPVRCPVKKCRSKNVRCYSSNPPIRYHVCRDCGMRFKSIEK